MPYQLPADVEQRVRAQIESGQFETEDDVLREAIDTLEKRQRGLRVLLDMVREADEDIAAGRVGPFHAEETKSAVKKRLQAHGIAATSRTASTCCDLRTAAKITCRGG
jgi:Arc/MetJ-type ribon-helix-helix transcriptional regulator